MELLAVPAGLIFVCAWMVNGDSRLQVALRTWLAVTVLGTVLGVCLMWPHPVFETLVVSLLLGFLAGLGSMFSTDRVGRGLGAVLAVALALGCFLRFSPG